MEVNGRKLPATNTLISYTVGMMVDNNRAETTIEGWISNKESKFGSSSDGSFLELVSINCQTLLGPDQLEYGSKLCSLIHLSVPLIILELKYFSRIQFDHGIILTFRGKSVIQCAVK